MTIFLCLGSIFKKDIDVVFVFFFFFFINFYVNSFAQFSTILEGKISPASSYEVIVEYQYQYLTYQPKRQLLTTNEKGEFNFNIPLKQSTWLVWKCDNKQGQIYLHVGDSLNVQIQLEKLSYKALFSGLGATENNFLQQWEMVYGINSKNTLYPKKYKEFKPKSFKNEVQKLRKNQFKFLSEAIGKQPLSDDFILALEHQITYKNANHLAEYPVLHAFLNDEPPQIMADEYYSFFEEIVIQSPSALNQPAYLRFLRNYLEFRYTQYHNENSLKAYSNLYYPFLFEITDTELKGSVQAHGQAILIIELIRNGNDLYKKYYDRYNQKHKEDKSAVLIKKILKNNEAIQVGKIAPNFRLQDATGKNIQLSDFRGKIVYLFFSPLKNKTTLKYLKGFEYLNNQLNILLEKKETSNNITFLWVQTAGFNASILSNEEIKNQFEQHNIIHLSCYFSDTLGYNLNKLPAAFLIDKEGKLVYSVTKLPTEAGVLEDISFLLKK